MRVISWNIQRILKRVGGKRIAEALLRQRPDVIALNEASSGEIFQELSGSLRHDGFVPIAHEAQRFIFRTIAFVNTDASLIAMPPPLPKDDPFWIELRVGDTSISAAYIPPPGPAYAASRSAHWEAAVSIARNVGDRRHLIIGDLNTTLHGVDEIGARVPGEHWLKALEQCRWTEGWRAKNSNAAIGDRYSWYSRSRAGFRLDQAWLSPALTSSLVGAEMDHGVRENGLSDHSMLIIDLNTSI